MDQEPVPSRLPDDLPRPVIPPPNLTSASLPPPTIHQPSVSTPPPIADPVVKADPVVNVTIRTGEEGDVPNAGLATFNSRVVATFIDMLISMGITILLTFLLPGFASKIAWVVGFAYLVTRDSLPFLGGQSVGKKAMKIRAVTLDDQPLTGNWETGGIRNGPLLIPFFPIIELVVLLTREDRPERGRRLGDEWAKTKVIVEPTQVIAES